LNGIDSGQQVWTDTVHEIVCRTPNRGNEEKPMPTNHILAACQSSCYCILTEGTNDPSIVLPRLLDALKVVSPECHANIPVHSIPRDALADETHAWWCSPAADAVILSIVLGLQRHAPEGFIFRAERDWVRLGFFPA